MSTDTSDANKSSEQVDKRIYIGGLHPTTTEQQIKDRFSKFGTVNDVTIAKNTSNECRGFAHMTIHTTPKKWETCLSVYNGAKWRGLELKLEEAKIDWQERKRLREEKIQEQEEKKKKRLERWNDSDGFHSKDMTLVTDNNLGSRKGWKRGRYGRAIAVMRLKKEDGTKFVFDPSHYKNNLTKLYNIGVRMKPVNKLITSIDSDMSSDEDDWPSASLLRSQQDDPMDQSDEETGINTVDNPDDQKRRAAMEKMFEEQRAKKELISRSLAEGQQNRQNHTTFSDDDDEKVDEAFETDTEVASKPADGKQWMFDDDDESSDDEDHFKINPVLEGEEGRKRLELQKKFKGDERFKLGEDFIEDEEKAQKNKKATGDDIAQELSAEKGQAMDVLRAMFGEVKVDTKPTVNKTQTWSNAARFDPEAEDASKYLIDRTQDTAGNVDQTEESDNGEEDDDNEDDDDDFFSQQPKSQAPMPEVSTEKHFEVNANLKPLFGDAEEAPFTLFGGDDSHNGSSSDALFGPRKQDNSSLPATPFKPKKAESRLGLGVMFFFHLDDPSLMRKSCYAYDADGVFQHKPEEKDAYESKWKTQRPIIKEILKKRQKNAVKNQKKRTTRDLK